MYMGFATMLPIKWFTFQSHSMKMCIVKLQQTRPNTNSNDIYLDGNAKKIENKRSGKISDTITLKVFSFNRPIILGIFHRKIIKWDRAESGN